MPRKDTGARLTWGKRFGFAVLGAGLGLSQAPFDQPFILFLILPFLAFLISQSRDWRGGFGRMWWAGFGYFALVMHWIVEPFLVDVETFGWMAPFALVLMASGLALFWGVAGGLSVKLASGSQSRIVLLAVAWSGLEFLRSTILTGFPWALLSYGWIETPLAQWASVLGPHGLGLATLLILFLPAIFAPKIWNGGLIVLVVVSLAGAWGGWREMTATDLHPRGTIVRLIQPNADQKLKWQRDMMPIFFQRQLGYSAARTGVVPDVVIWPETSLPFFLGEDADRLQMVADAAGPDTDVIAGGLRRNDRTGFNSLVHLDGKGGVLSVFDKHHLVPFGEYLPFAEVLSQIGLRGLADTIGGFSEGKGPRVLNSLNLPPYVPLICYEAIFPSYARSGLIRPDWLVHITNDAWFGSFSGPYQHLVQAQMRAIEQGLPVARAANTGISAMIDPVGKIVASLAINEANYLDVALPAPKERTLYSKLGDFPFFATVFLLLLMCLIKVRPNEIKQ